MGYQAHKDGIKKILIANGFSASKNVFSFEDESDQSVDKKFRITRPATSMEGEDSEWLQDRIRPEFNYNIVIGFKTSPTKGTFDYDVAQNMADNLLQKLNNPANYTSFCIKLHAIGISEEEVESYLEITFTIVILDDILYT